MSLSSPDDVIERIAAAEIEQLLVHDSALLEVRHLVEISSNGPWLSCEARVRDLSLRSV